ncbi:MAG: DUF362 domain-containing protein [Desulfobacterales bacterium]|nr:DUF362 domain-containing protein [Desulfobacterales bacterium]
MNSKTKVSIVKYEKPNESVSKAIELSNALANFKSRDKVYIKPNIVFWSRQAPVPPWGVLTTTRVVEDVIRILKDAGASQIIIGEGIITTDPKDKETPLHAFETLGYNAIAKRYGAKIYNNFERPFKKVQIGDDIELSLSSDLLESDFVANIPVLKTHAQTKVSLSQKNLKGCLDMESRKKCHSDNLKFDLDFHVAKLAKVIKRSCAVIDGIYTLERGPAYTGTAKRSNLIIASSDMIAADIVGAGTLGFNPADVPHIKIACELEGIIPSFSSVEICGESLESVAVPHQWDFPYKGNLPSYMAKIGVQGLSFPKYDHSLCSYCSALIGVVQVAIGNAWKGKAFDNVEILTGKMHTPTEGMNHTVLFGKCQVALNKNNPIIKDAIVVPGCPPKIDKLISGLKQSGIELDPSLFENIEMAPAFFMAKYKGKPEFSQEFYRIY